MSNMICVIKCTIVIPRLPSLFSKPKAVSSTIVLDNLVTSDYVDLIQFATWTDACKYLPSELVGCSNGWRTAWLQRIRMVHWLGVSFISHCKSNRQHDAGREIFQPISHFEPIFIEAHKVSKMISKVRLYKSGIKSWAFLEEIIIWGNELFKDFNSDVDGRIRIVGNQTRETAESYHPV